MEIKLQNKLWFRLHEGFSKGNFRCEVIIDKIQITPEAIPKTAATTGPATGTKPTATAPPARAAATDKAPAEVCNAVLAAPSLEIKFSKYVSTLPSPQFGFVSDERLQYDTEFEKQKTKR